MTIIRVRTALKQEDWLGAVRAVAPIARKKSLTPAERRTVLLVSRHVYAAAEKAYRRGDRRLAWQLARALRRIPGPYKARAAQLDSKIQVWLRSQRKGRSPVRSVKKKSARPVRRAVNPATGAPVELPQDRPRDPSDEGLESVPDVVGGVGALRPVRGAKRASAPPLRRAATRPGVKGAKKTEPRKAGIKKGSARAVTIRRNPHMSLSVPEPIPAGSAFEVAVWADEQAAQAGERSESIVVTAPEKVREFVLSVTLLLSAHFRADGETHKELVIRRDEPETGRLTFAVSVRTGKLPRSQPEIAAIFTYKGRPSGKIARQPAIAGLQPLAPETHALAFAPGMEVTPEVAPPPPVAEIDDGASAADLTITILDTGAKDYRHYRMIVDAAGGAHWEGDWVLSQRSDELVKTAMDAFVASDETQTGTTGRIAALTGAGIDMFDATPEGFKTLFWNLVDTTKPKTMLIVSEEPYIPWELMVPTRWRNNAREDREPIGVEFAVGRWVHRQHISPPQRLSFKETYVVAPRYSAERRLPLAEKEAKLVAKAFPPSRRIDPASVTTLDTSVGGGDVTLLHFVCHGKADAPQTIYMDNEQDNLNTLQVKALKGFLRTFPRTRTFVFLNACEVGRPAPSLVGIGGLANEFLAVGAGAVIAPLWSVADNVASDVAKTFYETVRKAPKTTFASILQGIRRKAYTGTAEDTWAAYCFYGDPKAALQ
jgi:hypothetical protein